MDKAPTYQDLSRQKAEAAVVQSQVDQRDAVAQDAGLAANANANPVLAAYMNRNAAPQGLTPRAPELTQAPADNGYTSIAESVAKAVPDQEVYSSTMLNAALKGQVSPESVLADSKVLDQAKVGLVQALQQLQQKQGLGQLQ